MSLMTRTEMINRIEDGEDTLELSIEKWEQVERIYLDSSEPLYQDDFNGETCALCYISDDDCANCLFLLTHGKACDAKQEDGNYYWQSAAKDVSRQKNRGYVRKMIEALEKCREEEK